MSVRDALEDVLSRSPQATDLEAEIARSLADQIDHGKGEGMAAKVKELRSIVKTIEGRQTETDGLDELAKKRVARRRA